MDPATASSVAARARTENFPVASLLFPRALRPHLRAIYGFARLVDIVGGEGGGEGVRVLGRVAGEATGPGARPAWLAARGPTPAASCAAAPAWEVMARLPLTTRPSPRPREPFL